MGEAKVSRRVLLAGMGAATGAVALGAVPVGAATGNGAPPGLPTVKGPGSLDQGVILQALPAVNPAYVYRTLAWHHFTPLGNPMPGVTFAGSAGMQATSPATFYARSTCPRGRSSGRSRSSATTPAPPPVWPSASTGPSWAAARSAARSRSARPTPTSTRS